MQVLKKHSVKLSIIVVLLMVIGIGCDKNISKNENNDIAFISVNTESDYQKTFEELSLGILFDFNLKLPKADKSWVEIWVEGYSNGEKIETPLTSLSYGLSPNQVDEGNMGFGIINLNSDERQFFLYAPGVSSTPRSIDNDIIVNEGISGWDYAISKKIGLESGEEKLLAVYRQSRDGMRSYDFQDLDSINEMIKEDRTVILLKIKIEEIEED